MYYLVASFIGIFFIIIFSFGIGYIVGFWRCEQIRHKINGAVSLDLLISRCEECHSNFISLQKT